MFNLPPEIRAIMFTMLASGLKAEARFVPTLRKRLPPEFGRHHHVTGDSAPESVVTRRRRNALTFLVSLSKYNSLYFSHPNPM